MSDERKKALDAALGNIEKRYGKGAVMKFGEKVEARNFDAISTGALSIDIALGIGGLPKGRIIEIYGPESSGKTTITLHVVAEVQKAGGVAAFIDAEHALDPVYAKKLGVNIEELYISQPDDGEQALEIVEAMVRSAAIDLIVIDSVAALVPKAEIDGEMGASHMGMHARLMSQALRKITGIANRNNVMLMFTNQLRDKIGVMFGNPETTTGGRALKFYASVRLDIRKGESIKQDGEIIGYSTTLKVAKNKVAPPFKTAKFDIVFGEGISKAGDVLDTATALNIVNKSGSWFSYNDTRLGQGREKVKDYLKENPEICNEIEDAVRLHYGFRTIAEMAKANEDAIAKATVLAVENMSTGPKPKGGKKSKKEKTKDDDDSASIELIEIPELDDLELESELFGEDSQDNFLIEDEQ